jgi:hypothetical protein
MKNNNDGYVLVLAVIILSVLLILMFSMSNLIDSDLSIFRNKNNSSRAFFAAESAISYGEATFWINSFWDSDTLELIDKDEINDLLEKSSVSSLKRDFFIKDAQPAVRFEAKGISGGVEKDITASFYYINSLFSNAITAVGNVDLANKATIDGDVYTTGDFDTGNNFDHNGNLYENQEEWPWIDDVFDFEELKDLAAEENSYFYADNDYTVENNKITLINEITTNPIDNIVTYIDTADASGVLGEVKLDQTVNGSGVLIINGDLNFGNNVQINSGVDSTDYFLIFVNGDLIIDNANLVEMQGFIYTTGGTEVKNNFLLEGAIITQDFLTTKNTSTINFDINFLETFLDKGITFPEGSSGSKKILYDLFEWQEL